ncbi:hypothetical protein H257_13202 [Aphanomyces astaci]|uniref:Uncharacterized protein n=1 Tax=Aphanomyces astaci TaxID=112090 RepID=W4FXN0_APHAT|nr:hypothetical protein H257_13202 [Aphanomyces astaci]ETV71539.1 hypothetical protein H257_13202 [Aphanomyces astaci]|eukprot:XP_009838972.1 hypothetical protein H257_13202 [Aphanomyces astaci]
MKRWKYAVSAVYVREYPHVMGVSHRNSGLLPRSMILRTGLVPPIIVRKQMIYLAKSANAHGVVNLDPGLPSGDGVKQDPEWIQLLCAIPYPTNAGDLQQFVCAVNWLRDSMTEYAQTMDPLQQYLTKALKGKGKKRKGQETHRVWCSLGTNRRRKGTVRYSEV